MGVLFAILAAIFYGIEPSLINIMLNNGVNELELTAISLLVGCLFPLSICILSKQTLKISKKELLYVSICGVAFFLTNLLLSIAYLHIPVGFTTMIHFTYPSLVIIVCGIFFKEKISKYRIFGVLSCLIGLLLISGFTLKFDLSGIIPALLSAIAFATYLIISDKTEAVNIPSQVFSFYYALAGGTFGVVLSLLTNKTWLTPISMFKNNLSYMLVASLLVYLAAYLTNRSIKLIGASKASGFSVVEPLTSLLVSAIIFRYDVPLISIIGCLFILISLYLSSK